MVAVGWGCLARVPRKPSMRVLRLRPASLSLSSSPPGSNLLRRSRVYRLRNPFLGKCRRAPGIFWASGRVWTTILRLVPTLKKALCQTCAYLGRSTNTNRKKTEFKPAVDLEWDGLRQAYQRHTTSKMTGPMKTFEKKLSTLAFNGKKANTDKRILAIQNPVLIITCLTFWTF